MTHPDFVQHFDVVNVLSEKQAQKSRSKPAWRKADRNQRLEN